MLDLGKATLKKGACRVRVKHKHTIIKEHGKCYDRGSNVPQA